MSGRRDPIEEATDGATDLYDVATWEVRGPLDRLSSAIYTLGVVGGRAAVVVAAVLILLSQLALGSLGGVARPAVTGLTIASVVPALLLAVYVRRADVTTSEPVGLLAVTFLLGVLFATFAAVVNTALQPFFAVLGFLGLVPFFYLVVGPVEETVKWLAVRLFAYRSSSFDAVVDGAVYGAVAGLGFATIENALYISQEVDVVGAGGLELVRQGGELAGLRALAGPGHVIYSAFAGYYLGLAKFNPGNGGPIVVKGLLIAALIHGTYNTLVAPVVALSVVLVPGVTEFVGFLGYVVAFDGLFGYLLYRKLRRYRRAFERAHDGERTPRSAAEGEPRSELTEFE